MTRSIVIEGRACTFCGGGAHRYEGGAAPVALCDRCLRERAALAWRQYQLRAWAHSAHVMSGRHSAECDFCDWEAIDGMGR